MSTYSGSLRRAAAAGSDTEYVAGHQSEFAVVVRQRIADYFTERKLSPKADGIMMGKIALGLSVWAFGFVLLYCVPLTPGRLIAVYALLGLVQSFLILNVAHDAIHNAVSRRGYVNRFLSYVYDGCGVCSYLVRVLHNHAHHSCINLYGEDDPLSGRRFFRFTEQARGKALYHFQHLYAPFFYALFSIDYVFARDFEDFFFPVQSQLKRMKHPAREYAILIGGKLLYLTVVIVLPIRYLGYSPLNVLLGFVTMHAIIGGIVAAVFAPTHILECNEFPHSRAEYEDYVHHIFATTCDFAVDSPMVTWLTGSLNHHIVHHICPQVCHTHYPELTKIVKRTAAEFGVTYKEVPTLTHALSAHFAMLKRLGSSA
jgi:linoleoyl-CoA desaturase